MLVSLCEEQHLSCGEIGLVYIQMIVKDTHPSYLRFIQMGETTLPEFWRDDARSRNHDMMGHIMEWFFTEVAGIKSNDGFKSISINPSCMDLIDSFECEFDSIRGKISLLYKQGKLMTELPNNTERKKE